MPDLPIPIAVIAPSPAIRAGLRALLLDDEKIKLCFEGASFPENEMPKETRIIILSSYIDSALRVLEYWLEGREKQIFLFIGSPIPSPAITNKLAAWGVLSIDANTDELMAAIASLNAGLCVGEANLLRKTLSSVGAQTIDEPAPEGLTRRETDILQLVAAGLSNKEIALRLSISDQTVKYHIASIYSKLGVGSRTEAVMLGVHLGLVVI